MSNTFKRQNYRPWDNLEKLTPDKPDTNKAQSEHKSDTNRTQTDNKLDTQSDTNKAQSEHKKIAVLENRTQTKHATGHRNEHKADTNRTQTDNKLDTFSAFVGIQRELLIFFYLECKHHRGKVTQELTLEHIASTLKIRIGSVKTSIKRLEEKQAIKRIKFKNGRGGWSQYELENHIYQAIMQHETGHKLNTNWTRIDNKVYTQPDTQPDTNAPSSSSDLINNKNTTTTELPPEWEEIDLSELQKRGIKFGYSHIKQLWPFLQKHLALDFQESIDGFVYDLDHSHIEARKGPLNLFIGVIRGGELYTSAHYVSPQQAHINATLELAKQKQEQRFQAWVEQNEETISKRLESENISHAIGFKNRLKETLEYIKRHLYEKSKV